MKLSIKGIYQHRLSTVISLVLFGHLAYKLFTGEIDFASFATLIPYITEAATAILALFFKVEKKKRVNTGIPNVKKSAAMDESFGFEYLGQDEQLAGYIVGWEYPHSWQAPEQSIPTWQLAEAYPEAFATVFPDPDRPRPKK